MIKNRKRRPQVGQRLPETTNHPQEVNTLSWFDDSDPDGSTFDPFCLYMSLQLSPDQWPELVLSISEPIHNQDQNLCHFN